MSAPDSDGPPGGHTPEHDPAVGVSSQETGVGTQEGDGMYLRRVASKDILRLRHRQRARRGGGRFVSAGRPCFWKLGEHGEARRDEGASGLRPAAAIFCWPSSGLPRAGR